MGGTALLGGLAKVASYGDKFIDQQAKLKVLGMTNRQVAEATARAWAITRQVPGTSVEGNLKSIGEMFSPVGFQHAIAMSTKMAQLDRVLQQVTGKEGSAYTTAKAGELMGVFTDTKTKQFDEKGFENFVNVIGRSAIATHGRVTPEMWLAFAKQAGPGASNLSEAGMMTAMEVMQAMGGFRAGTAMQALNRQFAGGIMAQRVAKELERIGIAKPGDFETGRGGQIVTKNGAMQDVVTALQKNPLDAIVDVILPKLIASGFDTNEKIAAEIYRMVGTGPGQRLIYELSRNSGQMKGSIDRARLAMPLDKGLQTLLTESPISAKGAAGEAFKNMMTALGSEGLRAAIPLMLAMTTFFNNVGAFAIAHPTAMKIIGEGLAAIGVALTVAGGLAIVAALGPVGWIALGIGALGVAILNFKSIWAWFVGAFEKLFGKSNAASTTPGFPAQITEGENGAAFGVFRGTGRRSMAPPPPNAGSTNLTGNVLMDGQKVGELVTGHQVNSMSGAGQGAGTFDFVRASAPSDVSWAAP
jgi:hypothetical protein